VPTPPTAVLAARKARSPPGASFPPATATMEFSPCGPPVRRGGVDHGARA
jgi:hypothetical protein